MASIDKRGTEMDMIVNAWLSWPPRIPWQGLASDLPGWLLGELGVRSVQIDFRMAFPEGTAVSVAAATSRPRSDAG